MAKLLSIREISLFLCSNKEPKREINWNKLPQIMHNYIDNHKGLLDNETCGYLSRFTYVLVRTNHA